MRTAIVYDRVNKWGGAERVLLTLHEMFPDAPLYTSIYSSEKAPWAKIFPKVIPSFLQKIPILNMNHELLGAFVPIAYESFNFDKYDLVISVTSEAAKGIITKPKTLHICYCLTPTRYLWSGYREYLNRPPKSLNWIPFYKLVSQPFLIYAKYWDKIAAQRPDVMIAISTEVQKRIKRYYNRESEIIFPPVDTQRFVGKTKVKDTTSLYSDVVRKEANLGSNYYLVVSRLVPYKKVDLAVDAFNKIGLPLIIVGIGSEEKRLKRMARKNIKFLGFVDEKNLVSYYKFAKALIFPQEEDFGITVVEAQAAGCPAIAYKAGGALDTVIEGKTGVFFDKQNRESLIEGVKKFEKIKFQKDDLIENTDRFSVGRFKKEFMDIIKTKV